MLKFQAIRANKETLENVTLTLTIVDTSLPWALIDEAMHWDKKDYSPNCFQVKVIYDRKTKHIELRHKQNNHQIYYLDASGDKLYLNYYITKQDFNQIITYCKPFLRRYE